jgi:hypothetical protein
MVVESVRIEPGAEGVQAEFRLEGGKLAPVVGLLSAVAGVSRLEVGAAIDRGTR